MNNMVKDDKLSTLENKRISTDIDFLQEKIGDCASYINKLHTGELIFLAPLAIEAMAIKKSGKMLKKIGMGRQKSIKFADTYAEAVPKSANLVIMGIAGGCDTKLRPGDIIIASNICKIKENGKYDESSVENNIELNDSDALAHLIQYMRLKNNRENVDSYNLYHAPIGCSDVIITGQARENASLDNIPAVEMESFWLASKLIHRVASIQVVRIILDTPDGELFSLASLGRLKTALKQLRQTAELIQKLQKLDNLPGIIPA